MLPPLAWGRGFGGGPGSVCWNRRGEIILSNKLKWLHFMLGSPFFKRWIQQNLAMCPDFPRHSSGFRPDTASDCHILAMSGKLSPEIYIEFFPMICVDATQNLSTMCSSLWVRMCLYKREALSNICIVVLFNIALYCIAVSHIHCLF